MHRPTALIMASAILFAPGTALAQSADHSDRGDVADFRHHEEDGEPPDYRIGADGQPVPTVSLSIGGMFLFDSNPAWASDGSKSALLTAPSVALTYAHPSLAPGWDFELSAGSDADTFSRDPDGLNETRLNAGVMLSHSLANAGTLSFAFRARGVYFGEGFSHFDHSLQRYMIGFAPNRSRNFGMSIGAEYRASPQEEQRRYIGTVNFDLAALESRAFRLDLFQEFAFSRFTAGNNDGRSDLLSLSEAMLTPELGLPDGVRLGIAAILFHRFSNRARSRFTGVQVGPTLGFSF